MMVLSLNRASPLPLSRARSSRPRKLPGSTSVAPRFAPPPAAAGAVSFAALPAGGAAAGLASWSAPRAASGASSPAPAEALASAALAAVASTSSEGASPWSSSRVALDAAAAAAAALGLSPAPAAAAAPSGCPLRHWPMSPLLTERIVLRAWGAGVGAVWVGGSMVHVQSPLLMRGRLGGAGRFGLRAPA